MKDERNEIIDFFKNTKEFSLRIKISSLWILKNLYSKLKQKSLDVANFANYAYLCQPLFWDTRQLGDKEKSVNFIFYYESKQ